ncbi:MAG: hypothetical protein B6D71_10975 [gamma proteobacterium symbiont of Stewartia floridana]|nr:MAG: hypothetical protein B6D71_10975 [gamma proteobacterium symbiont of Stewartia floridana]
MTTTDNHETKITYLNAKSAFKGVTAYKEMPLNHGTPLKGKTLIREIAMEDDMIFLKGATYINDGFPKESTTLIRLSDFNKSHPFDEVDLLRCLI